ncbi:MAG: GFA family protein [Pseudomonadota bacterium]
MAYDADRVLWRGHCHCDSGRRNCAAPVTTFFAVANDGWHWTGETPSEFQSSDHATRLFCAKCGTPMAYRSTRYPDETHFYAATLADPVAFEPEQHFHWSEHLPWLPLADDLPRNG